MNEKELILSSLLNCTRAELYLSDSFTHALPAKFETVFNSIIEKRKNGEPLQYILGKCEFFGLEFKVRSGVFIPRPETEILVEETIKRSQRHNVTTSQVIKILDIGTGSGNIAISLAKNIPNAKITAVDISQDAIDLALENAKIHEVDGDIEFFKSDIFSPKSYELRAMSYDIIVSNPPYIKSEEILSLQAEVQCEPRIALDGGRDGLDFYRKIIKLFEDKLNSNGFLLFEIGFGQASDIVKIASLDSSFRVVEKLKDYNSIERVLVFKKK